MNENKKRWIASALLFIWSTLTASLSTGKAWPSQIGLHG